jgi:hypothetical protein
MSITGPNSYVLRESTNVFSYQPGKSLQILATMVMATGSYSTSGLTQRVGYFSSLNGIYVQCSSGSVSMNIRDNGLTTSIPQGEWNTDTLNGSGPSGLTLDITKAQIFFTDIEWLGVGTVNVGFVINSAFIVVHKFYHANLFTQTYMTTATLPIRYEIRSDAYYPTLTTNTLQQICSTVISEGGYQALSRQRVATLGTSTVSVGATNFVPLVNIRLRSDRLDSVVLLDELNLFAASAGNIQYILVLNGTIAGGSLVWSNFDAATSNVDVSYTTGLSISGGSVIDTGFLSSSSQAKATFNQTGITNFNTQLGRSIDGISDVLTLAVKSFSGSTDVTGSLQWLELN